MDGGSPSAGPCRSARGTQCPVLAHALSLPHAECCWPTYICVCPRAPCAKTANNHGGERSPERSRNSVYLLRDGESSCDRLTDEMPLDGSVPRVDMTADSLSSRQGGTHVTSLSLAEIVGPRKTSTTRCSTRPPAEGGSPEH